MLRNGICSPCARGFQLDLDIEKCPIYGIMVISYIGSARMLLLVYIDAKISAFLEGAHTYISACMHTHAVRHWS